MVLKNQLIYLVSVKTLRKIFSNHVCFSNCLNFNKRGGCTITLSFKSSLYIQSIINKFVLVNIIIHTRFFWGEIFDVPLTNRKAINELINLYNWNGYTYLMLLIDIIMNNGHLMRAFFKNIPNNLPIWADGPKRLLAIWGTSNWSICQHTFCHYVYLKVS